MTVIINDTGKPLGLCPRHIWLKRIIFNPRIGETTRQSILKDRLIEINRALQHNLGSPREVQSWIDEKHEILKLLNRRQHNGWK